MDRVGDVQLTARSAHVCVDMQRLFAPGAPWSTPWMDRVLPRIIQITRRHPERTIFTRFIPPWCPEDAQGAWRIYFERWRNVTRERLDPELLRLVPPLDEIQAPVVDKPAYSPFVRCELPELLARRGADWLVVTGAETDVCVLGTVLGAIDHGYRVVVVRDAVCSSSDKGHDGLMTMFEERFREQLKVMDTDTLLDAWRVP